MAVAVQCTSCARFIAERQFIPLQRKPLLCSVFLSSRSRKSSIIAASSKKKNKKKLSVTEGDEEDAFELLFKQLEEDLKNDDLSHGDDSGDEISEEEIAAFERELGDALGEYDAELLNGDTSDDTEAGDDPKIGNESSLELRNWQMKKLARALKTGRRKTSIKNLAAELCLDRAIVLELLRNPPPNLLMMSLSLRDEPTATVTSLVETKPTVIIHEETSTDHVESGPKAQVPIHTMQRTWSAQKRLKKAHVDTLERVFRRSKRPTFAPFFSLSSNSLFNQKLWEKLKCMLVLLFFNV
ncbi:hypothetical protein VNO77_25899 [Canavalia gladiata]|uniref:Protein OVEREXPRESSOR OF CATIONIC PEROXIDASE 3 n=1 Tax=Canavalia gladiata TaxID=3824 RepID=A0AAN9KSU6_CANGL